MGICHLSSSLWMCVSVCLMFSTEAFMTVRKDLQVGSNVTLNCTTDWDPDISLYWYRANVSSSDDYIVRADLKTEYLYKFLLFQNNLRLTSSYKNVSSVERKIAFALHISDIAEEDTANYTCISYKTTERKTLSKYDIQVKISLDQITVPSSPQNMITVIPTEPSTSFLLNELTDLAIFPSPTSTENESTISPTNTRPIPSSTQDTSTLYNTQSNPLSTQNVSTGFTIKTSTQNASPHDDSIQPHQSSTQITSALPTDQIFTQETYTTRTHNHPTTEDGFFIKITFTLSFAISFTIGLAVFIVAVALLNISKMLSSTRKKVHINPRNPNGKKSRTPSTTIPDFTFHNCETRICHLQENEHDDAESSHYYAPILERVVESAVSSTDKLTKVHSSDSEMSDSGAVFCGIQLEESTVTCSDVDGTLPGTYSETTLQDTPGQDTSEGNLSFELENKDEALHLLNSLSVSALVETHLQQRPRPERDIDRLPLSGDGIIDNILYKSIEDIRKEPVTYFVLEDAN